MQQSSQLIGAQRKKICGSVFSGAAGVGSPTGRTPHDRSLVPYTRSIGISAPPAAIRPDQVPHCVSRVESITSFVPTVIVWRGSSSATVRAVNVTSASIPRSAASARTRVTRSGSTTSIVNGPIAGLRAVLGDPARREHRPLHTVVHDRERGVDDAAVRVHRHAGREVEVLGVAVEPEAVVVVRVTGRGVRDRQRGLVDRVVVEGCQHARRP